MKMVTIEQKQTVLNTFNANPSGCFIAINGYENSHGEVANYQIQSGVNYGNIKAASIKKLSEIKAGQVEKEVTVRCMVWQNEDGTIATRKGAGRKMVAYEQSYAWDSADFQKACDAIMEGFLNPRETTHTFEKEAKGLYSMDEETLYIRDCLLLNKAVIKEGVYPESATAPFTALKDTIRGMLPVSKYRAFKLENFDNIMVNGNLIV
jgi:hypothetical protein